MGLLLIIIAAIFDFNGTDWFSGETGVQHALYWIGAILIAIQVLWVIFVGSVTAAAASKASRRF